MEHTLKREAILCCLVLFVGLAGTAAETCDTALLVIDVQNMFLDWHPWVTAADKEIVPALEELLVLARSANIPVIHIRDLSLDPEEVNEQAMAIVPELAPEEGENVFVKLSGSAFSNPDLAEYLDASGIRRLLISGIASDGCVQATIFGAYRASYDVFIVTDAHAHSDGTPESAEQRNAYWLGLGLEGQPMAEIDWEAFGCAIEDAESDF